MDRIASTAAKFLSKESGVTAIEYALMASLIAVACVAAFGTYASALSDLFTKWVVPALGAL